MVLTNLPINTSGVIYQNDSPTPLLVTVQAVVSFGSGAAVQPVIFNSTANPADQALAAPGTTASRTYVIAPQQGIQVNAPSGASIGFDVLIAPAE